MGDPGGFSPGLAFQYAMSTPGGGSSTHPDQGMPPDFAMRPLLLSTLAVATACAVALICAAPRTADASTGIARCAMSDGTYAYTDTACNRLGGRHHALPAEVLNRIRRDRRQESQRNGRPMEDDRLLAAAPRDSSPVQVYFNRIDPASGAVSGSIALGHGARPAAPLRRVRLQLKPSDERGRGRCAVPSCRCATWSFRASIRSHRQTAPG